jgi:ABC-type bacteriocin/lantibiotic exporter with double-glycine peptidase domain
MPISIQPTYRRRRQLGGLVLVLWGIYQSPAVASSPLFLKVPFFPDKTDQCGPATLAGVLSYWGKSTTPQALREEMYTAKLHGTLPMDLVLTAEAHGLKTKMVRGTLETLQSELRAGRPVLVMLNTGLSIVPIDHFVIVTGLDGERQGVLAHSSGTPNRFISYKKFLRLWEKTDYWTMLSQPGEAA